jgi:transketolase
MSKFDEHEKIVRYMIELAGSGHYASSMSALEIMVPLFYEQGVTPDRFILSKGHAAPALYAILFDLGYLNQGDIDRFREYGGLPGHPSIETPGVLCSSGSLGMGISKALGLAWANPDKVYHVLVGDGELQEGQNWEALTFWGKEKIDNIHLWIDGNLRQYSGMIPDGDGMAQIYGCGKIHFVNTTWHESNKYLTRPQNPEYAALIDRYSDELLKAMGENDKIVVLDADLKYDFGLEKIEAAFPDRFIECGISEQHMVSMAGGLARAGLLPVCHTFSAFYKRCIDQLNNNVNDGLKIGYVAGLINHGTINIGSSHEPTTLKIFQSIGLKTCAGEYHFGYFFEWFSGGSRGSLLLELL